MILSLGIVALLLLGPLCGVPAWVMGRRDLKRIKSGELAPADRPFTQAGMVLGIVGTFLSPAFLIGGSITLAIILSLFRSHAVEAEKQAMMADAVHIARVACDYRNRPAGASGGGGSYKGFTLSEEMKITTHGKYYVRILSEDFLQVVGVSTKHRNDGLVAEVNRNGTVDKWIFSGSFEPRLPFFFRQKPPSQDESTQHV